MNDFSDVNSHFLLTDKNTKKSGLPKGIPQAFPLPWLL